MSAVAPARDVVVIGAGWAGLAAALRLTDHGRRVCLIDAAPQAGGRARRVDLHWRHPEHGVGPVAVDNGQHLLLGAYSDVLALLARLGGGDRHRVDRRPMRLASSSGLLLQRPRFADDAPGAPGASLLGMLLEPWSLLVALARAHGLSAGSRWAMIRALLRARIAGWRPPAGVATVADWYRSARQPPELVARIWQPIVVSAMNTPADDACAATFLRVLRDSFGATPAASDFVLPHATLSDLFVDPAIASLRSRGGLIRLRSDIRRIERLDGNGGEGGSEGREAGARYRVIGAGRSLEQRRDAPMTFDCDEIVIATPPYSTARLLDGLATAETIAALERFDYLPITTAYLGWDAARLTGDRALPSLLALNTAGRDDRPAQWFFDRGTVGHWRVAALVISDSRAARALGDARAGELLARQAIEELQLPPPEQLSLIHEKRATIACTPDRPRIGVDAVAAALPGIMLAGDYTYCDYPATLEGAVRSGRIAADALLRPGR
ncbi:MAG: hydroxysqualene dehydroxylase HpnE [Lautropia sp.]